MLLKIVLLNQSLGLPQVRFSSVTALQCIVPARQIQHLCTHFPNSPYASGVHPQYVMPSFSASCPPWTCCFGAVGFAEVYMVDLGGFSVVMDQP